MIAGGGHKTAATWALLPVNILPYCARGRKMFAHRCWHCASTRYALPASRFVDRTHWGFKSGGVAHNATSQHKCVWRHLGDGVFFHSVPTSAGVAGNDDVAALRCATSVFIRLPTAAAGSRQHQADIINARLMVAAFIG